MRDQIVCYIGEKRRVITVSDTGYGRFFQKTPDLETHAQQLVWDWLQSLPEVRMETARPEAPIDGSK